MAKTLQKQASKCLIFMAKLALRTTKSETSFSKFPSGDTSLRNKRRPGRYSDLDEDALKEMVERSPRKSTRELALDLSTSQSTIFRHVKEIVKVSKLGVYLFRSFSEKNKEDRISITRRFLSTQRNIPFVKYIVTSNKDESPQPIPIAKRHGSQVICEIIAVLFIMSF